MVPIYVRDVGSLKYRFPIGLELILLALRSKYSPSQFRGPNLLGFWVIQKALLLCRSDFHAKRAFFVL